jgi:hypothetical protein
LCLAYFVYSLSTFDKFSRKLQYGTLTFFLQVEFSSKQAIYEFLPFTT